MRADGTGGGLAGHRMSALKVGKEAGSSDLCEHHILAPKNLLFKGCCHLSYGLARLDAILEI